MKQAMIKFMISPVAAPLPRKVHKEPVGNWAAPKSVANDSLRAKKAERYGCADHG